MTVQSNNTLIILEKKDLKKLNSTYRQREIQSSKNAKIYSPQTTIFESE